MSTLQDTNILLRWVNVHDPQHMLVIAAIDRLRDEGENLWITPQNLTEYRNVATRPPDRNGLGLTPDQTEQQVQTIERIFPLLPEVPAIYPEWRRLVIQCSVSGRQVYDARLAATMLAHGITHLLTFNVEAFRRYPGITGVRPQEIVNP